MIHARAIPALITLILVMPFIKVSDHAMAQSPNLLMNPDFEDEGRWLFQDGVREIVMPPGGWFAFWRPSPPDDLLLPSNCPRRSDFGCYWARPEFRDVKASDFPNRVHSASCSMLKQLLRFGKFLLHNSRKSSPLCLSTSLQNQRSLSPAQQ